MNRKFATIVLVGEPNSGKSTLLNTLIGEKLSIVTHKVQTTRKTITGIVIRDNCQIVIYDTPGIFNDPATLLEKKIVGNARHTISENDKIYIVIDSSAINLEHILKLIQIVNKPNISLLFNKIDIADAEKLKNLEQELKDKVSHIFRISALTNEGINELLEFICGDAEESPWLYPEDEITTIPERELAADITREKLFLKLHQELPYSLTVETELWKDQILKGERSVTIHQIIYTKRESHKKIIIGKNGLTIKNIGIRSRTELERTLGCKVNLLLFVKVRANWEELDIV